MTSETLNPNFMGIHQSFSETEHGQRLADNVRYERYKPEGVSNERWVEVLGPDVNNLSHLTFTYGLTKSFVHQLEKTDPNCLTDQEKGTLSVASLIHDWAESVVGDLSWDEKCKDAEAEEAAAFDKSLADFYDGESSDIKEQIKLARDEVIYNPESKLGRIFNAIERAGYIRTALRASKHVIKGDAKDCEDGLRWIVGDVFGNHIIKTLEYANDYPPIYQLITDRTDDISDAFSVVNSKVFENYKPNQVYNEIQEYIAATQAWEEWVKPVASLV